MRCLAQSYRLIFLERNLYPMMALLYFRTCVAGHPLRPPKAQSREAEVSEIKRPYRKEKLSNKKSPAAFPGGGASVRQRPEAELRPQDANSPITR
jgi:hypothetical protein